MATQTRDLIGDVIITGIPAARLDADTRRALEGLRPSGVILFRRNVESVDQLRGLVEDLHALPSRPLVSMDHEGGRVQRLDAPFTHFPPAAWIGAAGGAGLARAVGRAMGIELASVGIDIDFAPVLDVDSNPANPIIGDRAFGRSPEQVIRLGVAFLDGIRSAGVLPCGKHFPGHGDTDRDSHVELPVLRRGRSDLAAVELPPFRAAIAADVEMLMTAHVMYPALDERNPATLSRPILQDLLRGELGFRGVVVSDDLEMRAISGRQEIPDAALASLRAGVDWLLVCNDLGQSIRVADRLVRALDGGEIDSATVAAAAARVRRLTTAAPRSPASLPLPEHAALNAQIRRRAAALGLAEQSPS
jgi:beta-N-acetylhexosaminidase